MSLTVEEGISRESTHVVHRNYGTASLGQLLSKMTALSGLKQSNRPFLFGTPVGCEASRGLTAVDGFVLLIVLRILRQFSFDVVELKVSDLIGLRQIGLTFLSWLKGCMR